MTDLRARRSRAGLTQAELAARSGVAQPNIAAYEAGRRRPSPATVARLNAALAPLPSAQLREHRDAAVRVLAAHKMSNPRVFGSVAQGQDHPGSDIDLLVRVEKHSDVHDDLRTWLEGWSLSLAEMNFLKTGYNTGGLLDVHIITDDDISSRSSFAVKINAITDPARPLAMKNRVI